MKMRNQTVGFMGEELAADYYINNGYFIAERNYVFNHGEIDIIAESETEIVFVEVKTRKYSEGRNPREAVDTQKIIKVKSCAENFLLRSHLKNFLKVRYDIVEVILDKNGGFGEVEINVIKNAF